MDVDCRLVERHFGIPDGILTQLAYDKTAGILVDVVKKCFNDALVHEQTKSQMETTLSEVSSLKCTLCSLENDIDIFHRQNVERSDLSKQLDEAFAKSAAKDADIRAFNSRISDLQTQCDAHQKTNNHLELKCSELLQTVDIKESQVASLNNELSETIKKWQKTNIECKSLICEVEMLKERVDSQKSTSRLSSFRIDEKVREIHQSLNLTIDEYSEKLRSRESEIDNLQLELHCRDKRIQLLSAETAELKRFRFELQLRCDEMLKRVSTVDRDLKSNLACAGRRLDVLEHYCNTQHQNSLDVSNKLTGYLSFIDQLKTRLHTSENERLSLVSEISAIKNESFSATTQADRRLEVVQKELSLLRSQSVGSAGERVPSEAMLDRDLLERISPTAVETSKLVRCGYTLTDIHAEYFREHEEKALLMEENKRAATKLAETVRGREDLKKALIESEHEGQGLIKANTKLSKRLNDARAEILSLNARIRGEKTKCNNLESELQKAIQVKLDLCGQITTLTIRTERMREMVKADDLESIEPENRVPLFGSVAELQTVNCRLLETLHDLESEIESLTKSKNSHVEESNFDQLEIKNRELSVLSKTLEVTTYQRDMYKLLYNQKSGFCVSDSDLTALHDRSIESANIYLEGDHAKARVTELERELEAKCREFNVHKEQCSHELTVFKQKACDTQVSAQTLETKLESKIQKCKQLQNSFNALDNKSKNQDEFVGNLHRRIDELVKQQRQNDAELSALRATHRALIIESENLRTIVRNLETENHIMHEAKASANPLVVQLQELSSQLAHLGSSHRSVSPTHTHALKEEISRFKLQLSALSSEFSAEKLTVAQKLESVKKSLAHERHAHSLTSQKLADLQQTSSSCSSKAEAPENVSELKYQIDHYRSIAESAEARLTELQTQHQSLSDTLVQEREASSSQINTYRDMVEKFQVTDTDVDSLNITSMRISELEEQNKGLNQERISLASRLDAGVLAHSDTIKRLNELSLDLQRSESLLIELHAKIAHLEEQLRIERSKSQTSVSEIERVATLRQEDKDIYTQETELLYTQIRELRTQLSSIQSDIAIKHNDNEKLEGHDFQHLNTDLWRLLEFVRNDKALTQARLENALLENARLSNKCNELRDTVDALEQSLQAERQLRNSQLTSLSSVNDTEAELVAQKTKFEQRLLKTSNSLDALNRKFNSATFQLEDLKEQLSSTKALYEDQFARNEVLKRQLEAANRNVTLLKERLSARKDEEAQGKQVKDLSERLAESQRELDEHKFKENSHLSLISKLKEQQLVLRNAIEKQKQQLKQLKQPTPLQHRHLFIDKSDHHETASATQAQPLFIQSPESVFTTSESQPLPEVTIKKIIPTSTTESEVPQMTRSLSQTMPSLVKPSNQQFDFNLKQQNSSATGKTVFGASTNLTVSASGSSRFALSRNLLKVDDLFQKKSKATFIEQPVQEKTINTCMTNTESLCVVQEERRSTAVLPGQKRPAQVAHGVYSLHEEEGPGTIYEEGPTKKFCEAPYEVHETKFETFEHDESDAIVLEKSNFEENAESSWIEEEPSVADEVCESEEEVADSQLESCPVDDPCENIPGVTYSEDSTQLDKSEQGDT